MLSPELSGEVSPTESRLLEKILQTNPKIAPIFEAAIRVGLPDWYLGAGCITQTVWNYQLGLESNYGIGDYDLVYYDPDISKLRQAYYQAKIVELVGELSVEVTNEARVHLWYEESFGMAIDQYKSVEEAINTWPTTASAVGVRSSNGFWVYAPFGLDDLFSRVIRPNKKLITREVYESKANKWSKLWPSLTVIPWEE